MIKRVRFHRFKRFKDHTIELRPDGMSLLVGGNNSGKSSILQGLAIWEFCKTVLSIERGEDCLFAGATRQGFGLSDDEFSPVSTPSLRHLWTNLHTQKDGEPDGYTLRICCFWDGSDGQEAFLETGLSLVNNRLFIKATASNLQAGAAIPRIAYLPPFAGMTDRETGVPEAIRRRLVGQGLAGAVLRNLLLDLKIQNSEERDRLKGSRKKIKNSDLRQLRSSDPWEILLAALQGTFSTELSIAPFNPLYHSYIRVEAFKGERTGARFRKLKKYAPRDLMVEGSGFLQWLSVYTLAVNPSVDALLLDEPDAHLHCSLQVELLDHLRAIAARRRTQVMIATHSTEIIKAAPLDQILHIRQDGCKYLQSEGGKIAVIAGLGSEYAPLVNQLQSAKRVLFVEARGDSELLQTWARVLGIPWPTPLVIWPWASRHKERKALFLQFASEINGLKGISLVDRDDEPLGTTRPKHA